MRVQSPRPASAGGRAAVPPTGPGMDPRFRQRRVDVKRQEGRRRLRFLALSLAVAGAAGGAVGATRSPLLDVDRVTVRGATRTPAPAVAAATGLDRRPSMVDVDTGRVARRSEELPWVLRARARRDWPGTVVIEVTERAPAAVVQGAAGGWAVVDGSGRVLEVTATRPAGAPTITGVPPAGQPGSQLAGSGPAGWDALRVAGELPALLRARVSEVVVSPSGEVVLQLRPPGGQVRLGRPDHLGPKLASAATVLEKANVSAFKSLDVRVPEAPVLTRR